MQPTSGSLTKFPGPAAHASYPYSMHIHLLHTQEDSEDKQLIFTLSFTQ